MTNDLLQRAETFAEDCDLYNYPFEAMADFAAAEIARREAALVERMEAGRHYLMSVDAEAITVEDALEAFGFGRNGLA